jgi:hypothetical protein
MRGYFDGGADEIKRLGLMSIMPDAESNRAANKSDGNQYRARSKKSFRAACANRTIREHAGLALQLKSFAAGCTESRC